MALAALALTFIVAPAAQASLGVNGFTADRTPGGAYQPMGVAVSGNGSGGVPAGTSYLAQGDGRISQFAPDGSFVRAFGRGVVASGEDEAKRRQRIDVDATGGSYRLRAETAWGAGSINGTNQVTGLTTYFGVFHVGDTIEATGIPAGTTITAVGPGTLQLSAGATANGEPFITATETTTDIAATVAPATVEAALEALPSVAEMGGVDVEGGPGGVGAQTPYIAVWPTLAFAPSMIAIAGTSPLSGGGATAKTGALDQFGAFEICNANPPSNDVCRFGNGNSHGPTVDPATGNVYARNENAIVEYSAVGKFIRSFGQEAVFGGPDDVTATDSEQSIDIPSAVTGGTFTLDFGGKVTAPLAYNATAATVQTALETLSSIGTGNVVVSGGDGAVAPFIATFSGALSQNPEPAIAVDSTNLVGGSGTVTVLEPGSSRFEICLPIDNCYENFGGSIGGALAEGPKGYLAVAPPGTPNAGNVIAADPGNSRVQEFSPTGEFIRAFGYDVVAAGPHNTASGLFEECKFGDACKAGSEGSAIGQFGFSGPRGVAVDATGAIYAVESSENFRVQKFSPQVGPVELSASLFGGNGAPNGTSSADTPTHIAIGPANHLLIVKRFAAGATAICPDGGPSAEESRVQELSSDGTTLLDTHMTCNGLRTISGVAYDPAHGNLFTSFSQQLGSDFPLYFSSPAEPPSVTLESLEEITSTGVKLVGKINPHSETSFANPNTTSSRSSTSSARTRPGSPTYRGQASAPGPATSRSTPFSTGSPPIAATTCVWWRRRGSARGRSARHPRLSPQFQPPPRSAPTTRPTSPRPAPTCTR